MTVALNDSATTMSLYLISTIYLERPHQLPANTLPLHGCICIHALPVASSTSQSAKEALQLAHEKFFARQPGESVCDGRDRLSELADNWPQLRQQPARDDSRRASTTTAAAAAIRTTRRRQHAIRRPALPASADGPQPVGLPTAAAAAADGLPAPATAVCGFYRR